MPEASGALSPHLTVRLRALGFVGLVSGAMGYSAGGMAGQAFAVPWSITLRETRLGSIELGEAITFMGGVAMLAAGARLTAVGRRDLPTAPSVRVPLLVAAASGLVAAIPSLTSLATKVFAGAVARFDLFLLAGGVALATAASLCALALVAWQREIQAYEAARTARRSIRPRRRTRAVQLVAAGILLVLGWWALGPLSAVDANERAAERVVQAFSGAQTDFKLAVAVDQDGDGFGEYAFLDELAGKVRPRGGRVRPQAWDRFPADFEPTTVPGVWSRRGYLFVVYLPSSTGRATAAPAAPDAVVPADGPFHGEAAVLYAWPVESGVTGTRAYFATEGHRRWVTLMTRRRYSGLDARPEPFAALSDTEGSMSVPGALDYDTPVLPNLNGAPADANEGLTAADGNDWVRLRR